MTPDLSTSIRASRYRIPRTRGALSGLLLVLLGAWAALVPFIGPYFDLAYTPAPDDAWRWTDARGLLEVLPGAVVFVGGLLLLFSTSRLITLFGGWLAAAGGAWLIVGPSLADAMNVNLGSPDPDANTALQAADSLLLFYAIGAAIVFLASVALGRLSVRTLRDVHAAERRVAAEEAAQVEPAAAPVASTDPEQDRDPAYQREPVLAGRHGRTDDTDDRDYPTQGYPVQRDYPTQSYPVQGQPVQGYQQPAPSGTPPYQPRGE